MKRIALIVVLSAGCKKTPAPVELGMPVHPFGVVADVWLGMTPQEVKQKAPQLKTNGPGAGDNDLYANPDGASYHVHFTGGRVDVINMQLMKRTQQDLWKAWGPGTAYDPPPFERRRYFDEARDARADVSVVKDGESFAITIVPMVPIAKLLDGPDAASISGVQLIGRQVKDVVDDLNAHHLETKLSADNTHGEVRGLPATEWTTGGSIDFSVGPDGVVQTWALIASVDADGPSNAVVKKALLAAYEHKWGKPVDKTSELVYGTDSSIHVTLEHLMPSVTMPPAAPPPASTGKPAKP